MDIKKAGLTWSRPLIPLDLNKVTAIALHHMAHPTAGIPEVHQWHLSRGWKGFAYNYWVDFHGGAWEGRGLNAGAGVYGKNSTIISIGFQGDYDGVNKTMPEAQFKTGIGMINYLKASVPSISLVAGHKYWGGTSCPGKYFPLGKMTKGGGNMTVRKFQEKYGLKVDGIVGPITSAKMLEVIRQYEQFKNILKEMVK